MTRFYFAISHTQQWYAIMRECRAWFGTNWRSQPKAKRKLVDFGSRQFAPTQRIWFEVPDERFGPWISIKMAVEVKVHQEPETNK